MIQRAREECLPVGRIVECLECLETACREQDVEAAERMLSECVVGFERQEARDSFASLTAPTSTAVINA